MAVNSRTLEIKVISAENLQLDRKPTKKNASVAVRSDINTQFRTKDMDTKGGGPPTVEREAHARLANALEVHHGGGPMQDFVRCQDDRDGDDSSIGFCWRLSAGGLPAFFKLQA
ncbi:BON1-associated protein 2-like [Pyrus ussuriensis x Pyrus communis]|uniref:BON1-associated protein 2-like n=1 Tax=Pyrus ussuriensis x Pyrus communis TaxID=2448454 RepID=A0A5N5FAS3_9ROSA|nr:BON1-associated protein 2-like [Pyrus ussuriensis x Pyrus communis]